MDEEQFGLTVFMQMDLQDLRAQVVVVEEEHKEVVGGKEAILGINCLCKPIASILFFCLLQLFKSYFNC